MPMNQVSEASAFRQNPAPNFDNVIPRRLQHGSPGPAPIRRSGMAAQTGAEADG